MLGQALGETFGLGLAAWAFAGSAVRGGRLLHPEGELYDAVVEPLGDGPEAQLGERLAGPALVRLSTGLRRGAGAHRDVLGCAIRFRWNPHAPEDAAQDLLLVTARHLLTLPLAFLLTDTRSYLANDYDSIAHFRTEELGTVRIRARPAREPLLDEATRAERLAAAAREGRAVLRLQARGAADQHWRSFARVSLTGPSTADDARLLFTPHHAALGLEPVGFVNALRRWPYPASRAGRALRARAPRETPAEAQPASAPPERTRARARSPRPRPAARSGPAPLHLTQP